MLFFIPSLVGVSSFIATNECVWAWPEHLKQSRFENKQYLLPRLQQVWLRGRTPHMLPAVPVACIWGAATPLYCGDFGAIYGWGCNFCGCSSARLGRVGSIGGPTCQTGTDSTPHDPDRTSANFKLQPHWLQRHPWIAKFGTVPGHILASSRDAFLWCLVHPVLGERSYGGNVEREMSNMGTA
jgi:hypothetical protein